MATALRWRALIYKHSIPSLTPITTRFQRHLTNHFQSIFITAGEKASSDFINTRIPAVTKESEIIECALILSEMLKTRMFSVHLDVYSVQPGVYFQEETMDADSKKPPRNSRVLCTLEIGLHEMIPQSETTRILLKSKVALEVS